MSETGQTTLNPTEEVGQEISPGTTTGELRDTFHPLLDGRQQGGMGPLLLCVNPSTGETFARVHGAGPEEIDRAVESAVAASAVWRGTPFAERSRHLLELADLIQDHAEGIAGLVAIEQGKHLSGIQKVEGTPGVHG